MKVFLHTEGLNGFDKTWVRGFKASIEDRGVRIIETDVFDEEKREEIKIYYEEGDFFITRFSQHRCSEWKKHHEELAPLFKGRMFPNAKEAFYYNDKDNERILLEEKGYPHPKTIYVKSPEDVSMPFPLVRKEKGGASSKNVSMVNSLEDIEFPCLLQEFCDGNDGDIRVNVIGDYVTGFKRFNRENDFRASGSHNNCYLGSCLDELPKECVDIACKISRENNFNCMCYDFVRDSSGNWVVLEFSYTFNRGQVRACEHRFNLKNGYAKEVNDCSGKTPRASVQDLVIRRLLDS